MRLTSAGSTVVTVLVAAALSLPAAASAAPITLGTAWDNSMQPSVALDQNGDAWVTWPAQPSPSTLTIDLCEVPAGQGACGPVQQLTPSFPWVSVYQLRSSIFFDPADATLWVLVGADVGNNQQLLTTSSSYAGGSFQPFGALRQIGNVNPAAGAAALDRADGLALTTSDVNESLAAQAAPLNAAAPGATSSAQLVYPSGGANTIYGSAVSFDGQNLVAAWGSGLYPSGGPLTGGPLSFAYLHAASLAASAVNTGSSWTQGSLHDGGSDPQLTGGPAGTVLAETIPGSATGFLDLRGFTGSGFGATYQPYCSDNTTYGAGVQSNPAEFEDSSGRLHLAYIGGGRGGAAEDVRYVTIAGGAQSAPQTLATNTSADLWTNLAVAGNATSAFAVWLGDQSDNVEGSWLPGAMPARTGCSSPVLGSGAFHVHLGKLTFTLYHHWNVLVAEPGAALQRFVRLPVSAKAKQALKVSISSGADKVGALSVKPGKGRSTLTVHLPTSVSSGPVTVKLQVAAGKGKPAGAKRSLQLNLLPLAPG